LIVRQALVAVILLLGAPAGWALDSVPKPEYHGRRVALAAKLHGGVALLFAADEPVLDLMPYRQDEDFYYLTGWNEPGAALLIVPAVPTATTADVGQSRLRPAQPYREILFLPTRNVRVERYTGARLDAANAGAAATVGVDEVADFTELPGMLNRLAQAGPGLAGMWAEPGSVKASAVLAVTAMTLGQADAPPPRDLSQLTMELRAIKSPAEIALLKKAADASMIAQRAMMRTVMPGVTERAVAGILIDTLMQQGCERQSYAPVVGSGANSTVLHYSENSATMRAGDVVVVDAAGDYSMYASDITRTVPVNGHFTARQREIYDIVLGAQRAAAAAFVAGRSKIDDPQHREQDSLDQVAFDYINAHGSDLHGQPLGQYMVHGLGHLVGIDVHDPWDYSKPLDRGMVFTIEPGIYLPEEKIGVRIEDVFYVATDGRLVDLVADLPHEAADVERAMQP
jgi:Xaa-Pro aminopeptidase